MFCLLFPAISDEILPTASGFLCLSRCFACYPGCLAFQSDGILPIISSLGWCFARYFRLFDSPSLRNFAYYLWIFESKLMYVLPAIPSYLAIQYDGTLPAISGFLSLS